MTKEVKFEGLELKLMPIRIAIIRTNETATFQLSIKNISDKERRGKILVQFVSPLGSYMVRTNEIIKLDPPLQPNETRNHEVSQDNSVEGTVVCQVAKIGSPESLEQRDDESLRHHDTSPGSILYSFRVIDEATYLEEQRKHNEVLKKIETMTDVISTNVLNQLKKEIYTPEFAEKLSTEYQKQCSMKEDPKVQLEHFK